MTSSTKNLGVLETENIKYYYDHIKSKKSNFTLEFTHPIHHMDTIKYIIKQGNNDKENHVIYCSDSVLNLTFVASKLKEYLNKLLPGNSGIYIEIVDIENYSDLENNSLLQKANFKFDKQYKAVVKLTDFNNYSEDISIKFQVRNQIYKNMNDFDLIYFATMPFRNSLPNNKPSKRTDSYFNNLKNQITKKIINVTFEKIMGSKNENSDELRFLKALTSKILVINSELKNRNQKLETVIELNDWHIVETAVKDNLTSSTRNLGILETENIKNYYDHIKSKKSNFTLEFANPKYSSEWIKSNQNKTRQ